MRTIIDLLRGIFRYPLKAGRYAFTAFSVIFTSIKAITHFLPDLKIEGPGALDVVILISVFFGLVRVWKPSRVELKIPHTNTVIQVLFGDFFEQGGLRAISVNDFFDSKIGKPVSEKSLHGIFLQKCFGGHPESFDKQVDKQLSGIEFDDIQKADGKTKRFPIGSTALITVNQDRYLMFAFAKTDPATCKATSDVSIMWIALNGLWSRARLEAGGDALNLPLVGSGLSGIGLPTRDLLNLILVSAIQESKVKQITGTIRVVLNRERFEDLDLRDVKKHWEER